LNGENQFPPTFDKSTIECPQIEVHCLKLVHLGLHLPKCHPCKMNENYVLKKKDLNYHEIEKE